MARHERFGVRDLTYSAWHRTLDDDLTYIDLDGVEYCSRCNEPLLLIEAARDVGQQWKATTVLVALAQRSNIRALLVFYRTDDVGIVAFRVREVWPQASSLVEMAPKEYADILRQARTRHRCQKDAR